MCGIIGYIGKRNAAPILLEGLRRLEYRGYDSAGIGLISNGAIHVIKKKGKIDTGLAPALESVYLSSSIGIGHTRWATHGVPSDENAHPHLDQSGKIAVVHNGIIENYELLRSRLEAFGHQFKSETDTEILAHLIGRYYEELKSQNYHPPLLPKAVELALREVIGTYGIAVICSEEPNIIVGARRGSPLLIGLGDGEQFLASDAAAIVAHTRKVIYLNDYDIVWVTDNQFHIHNIGSGTAHVQIQKIEYDLEAIQKGGFPHFMLKEIFEQPQTVRNACRGRLDFDECSARFGGLNIPIEQLRSVERIVIAACGTSRHAGMVGEYLIEEFAHIPVEVEYASEFRYRNAPLQKDTLVMVITQSGETADTLAALREAKRKGHHVLAICNVVGSTIAREAHGGIYLHAGPEIGVASTKAFTSQVAVLTLFALYLGRMRYMSPTEGLRILRVMEAIPELIEQVLKNTDYIQRLALQYAGYQNFFYLGRLIFYPVALEGALKLKEISYVHAEALPAAEMKHGPIALIDKETPCLIIIPNDTLKEKTLANLQELKARGAPVIALAEEGDNNIAKRADDVIWLPKASPLAMVYTATVALQLFAYFVAVARDCDVDKPRNLAKSVTVE